MPNNEVKTELLSQIKEVLLKFPMYWEKDNLLRSKVAEDLRSYNQDLIKAFLSNELIKDTYSIKVDSTIIFKVEDFISMLRYKNYWDNSYTKYTNKIGLTSEEKTEQKESKTGSTGTVVLWRIKIPQVVENRTHSRVCTQARSHTHVHTHASEKRGVPLQQEQHTKQ